MDTEAMEWARIARSFFWPGGVIALFFIVFYTQIRDFIAKIDWFRVGPSGAEAGKHHPDQGTPPPPPSGDPPPTPPEPTAIPSTSNEIEQLRAFQYYWFYERLYRVLFGTQTMALRHVNTQPAGAPRPHIEQFYSEHEKRVREAKIEYQPDWNRWISYMTDAGLLRPEGDQYHITPLGRGFLQWMTAEGLSDNPLL